MADMCSCMITGRLTKDAEVKYAGQAAVLNFSVAVGRYEKGAETTSYFDCVQWGKAVESLAPKLTKGSPVVVRGDMRQEFWNTREGDRRSKWVLLADPFGVQPLQSGRGGGSNQSSNDQYSKYDDDDDPIPF